MVKSRAVRLGPASPSGRFSTASPSKPSLASASPEGERVSVALLVAIFLSNLPEGIGAGVDMQAAGALLDVD